MVARRILVLGGSGFIGTHLVQRLLLDGHDPVVFDRIPPPQPEVEYHRGDMASAADLWQPLLEGVDAIFHLAWTTKPQSANDRPRFDLESNVVSLVHLLDGVVRLQRCPRIIFLSTGGAIYGATDAALIDEEAPKLPLNAYGVSKLTAEHYLRLYRHLHGLDYLVFRPGNPYGEGQDPAGAQGAVAVFLGRIAADEAIVIWGDGEVMRDYFYVGDLVDALVRALDYRPGDDAPRVFNLGSGSGVSLNELIRLLAQVSGRSPRVEYQSARKADAPRAVLDITRARQWLGWAPATPLADGLGRTWEWVRTLKDRRRGAS